MYIDVVDFINSSCPRGNAFFQFKSKMDFSIAHGAVGFENKVPVIEIIEANIFQLFLYS